MVESTDPACFTGTPHLMLALSAIAVSQQNENTLSVSKRYTRDKQTHTHFLFRRAGTTA